MLEKIHGIPQRIADLKRKLAAREGKSEFKENVPALKAEIVRLEELSQKAEALREFVADQAPAGVASTSEQG